MLLNLLMLLMLLTTSPHGSRPQAHLRNAHARQRRATESRRRAPRHSDPSLFMNLYSHVTPSTQREAAERIGAALFD